MPWVGLPCMIVVFPDDTHFIGTEKTVLAKGSFIHPGWIWHKMTCRDRVSEPSEFEPLKFYCTWKLEIVEIY